jgi:hypothetical protein
VSELDARPHCAASAHRLAGAADALGAAALLDAVRQFDASPTPAGVQPLRDALEDAARGHADAPPPPPPPPDAVADDACAVCLEPLGGAGALLQLSCGHRFHAACLTQSARRGHSSCPLCRAAIGAVRVAGGEELVPARLRGVGLSADAVWRELHAHAFAALGAPDAICLATTVDLAVAAMGRPGGDGAPRADVVLLDSRVGAEDATALAATLRASGFDRLVCVLTALPHARRAALARASPDLDLVLPKGVALDALAARLRLALAAKRLGLPLGDGDGDDGDAAEPAKRAVSLLDALPGDALARLLAWLPLRDRMRMGRVSVRCARRVLHAAPPLDGMPLLDVAHLRAGALAGFL